MTALIGLNAPGDGSVLPTNIVATGARFVRVVAYPDHDISAWIEDLARRGVETLLILAGESFAGRDQAEMLTFYSRRYGSLVKYWQPGNEADHQSESSWTQSKAEVSRLLRLARAALPDAYLVGPGLVSGNPDWLDGVDLGPLDAISCHPYGQRDRLHRPEWDWLPGNFGVVTDLLDRYAAKTNLKIWVTEVGLKTGTHGVSEAQQAEYLAAILPAIAAHPRVERVAWFAYHNFDGFGLVRNDGEHKSSWEAFRSVAATMPPVEPEFWYALGFLAWSQLEPELLGQPLENERGFAPGVSAQRTSTGLLFWVDARDRQIRAWVDGSPQGARYPSPVDVGETFGFVRASDGQRYRWRPGMVKSEVVR